MLGLFKVPFFIFMQCEVCQKELKNPHQTNNGVVLCRKHFDSWWLAKNRHTPEEPKEQRRGNQHIRGITPVRTSFRKYLMTSYEIQVWFNQNPFWKNYYEDLREQTKQKLSQLGVVR